MGSATHTASWSSGFAPAHARQGHAEVQVIGKAVLSITCTYNVSHETVCHVQTLRRRSPAYFLWYPVATVLVVIAIIVHHFGVPVIHFSRHRRRSLGTLAITTLEALRLSSEQTLTCLLEHQPSSSSDELGRKIDIIDMPPGAPDGNGCVMDRLLYSIGTVLLKHNKVCTIVVLTTCSPWPNNTYAALGELSESVVLINCIANPAWHIAAFCSIS